MTAQAAGNRQQAAGTAGFATASVLTRAELLDHARHPRNRGELPNADIVQKEANPLCGDVVTMYARITRHPESFDCHPEPFDFAQGKLREGSQDKLREGSRTKRGDPSSPEPALERSEGAPQDDTVVGRVGFTGSGCIIALAAASMLSEHVVGKTLDEIKRMERADVEALLGAAVSPSRVKCAMLPLIALQHGLRQGISSPS